MKENKKFSWWQLGLASVAASAIGGLSSGKTNMQERKLYEKELAQAPWAPPGWLFAPAWTINNFFLLKALQQLLQKNGYGKKKLLVEQGFIWLLFFSYGYIYFNKKSPVLAALWTVGDAALATSSFLISKKEDKKIANLYLPLLGWTAYASTIAVYQALKNYDPVLHFSPKKGWKKVKTKLSR